ncbi:Histidine kinase [Gulosibacter molinativorax]|nr:Histidine kinase [Gulosibacter molinativorax]
MPSPRQLRRRTVSRATIATLILSALTVLAATLLLTVLRSVQDAPLRVVIVLASAVFQLALAMIASRARPEHPLGMLLAAFALVLVTVAAVRAEAHPILAGNWMLLYLPPALILLLAPDGRAASRRWGLVGWMLGVVAAAFMAFAALEPYLELSELAVMAIAGPLLLLYFALLAACAAAPLARYRAASESDRSRLRWVLVAGLSLPVTLLLCWASYLVFGVPDLVVYGLGFIALVIPAGATIAIARPELFDVDRAMIATLAAIIVASAGLAILTVAGVVIGRPMTAWGAIPAAVVSGLVAVAAAVAFPFVRRMLGRLFSPERARTLAALRRFASHVDSGDARPESVREVLRESLRDPGLEVGYRRLTDRALVLLDGTPAPKQTLVIGTSPGLDGAETKPTPVDLPIHARGEEIGAILPSRFHPLRTSGAIAREAAPFFEAIRMRAELSAANAELEASRRRLLTAEYAERQRLERDLHDGAQQRLVALGMQLRVLQRTAALPEPIADGIDVAVAQLSTAVAEIRQLAHGMRPVALDDGLGPALARLERDGQGVVELDVRADDLPDAVATTAYYVVNEAVTNALRHAEASRIRVMVRRSGDMLRVTVADNGRGGARLDDAHGLRGLADRVQTLGGELTLESRPGAGTTLAASIPCAS